MNSIIAEIARLRGLLDHIEASAADIDADDAADIARTIGLAHDMVDEMSYLVGEL